MNECLYCNQQDKRDSLMTPVCELDSTIVYLVKNQNFPGRCAVALKDHKEELFQLTSKERISFFEEVSIVAEAIYHLYSPDKLNYAIYGDGVPHLHIHIVPKKKDGFCWGGPFVMDGNNHILSEEDAAAESRKISKEILRLTSQQTTDH